jgi:hypothetical protein
LKSIIVLTPKAEETTCVKDVRIGIYRWIHVLAGKGDKCTFLKEGAVREDTLAGNHAAQGNYDALSVS